ncbi:unnamed protein product [Pleuronectes platessa]|uniref:HMG box domain-containing protein n=1 Tax=Pleuronectes platessa TaxID=8262 RepID=A0A9N7UEP8_PLEPL|nr:unnamed protein product [Pleuronectes platessa]
MYLGREEMIDMGYSTLDLNLVLEVLESDLADSTFPPTGPQLSPELSLQQPVRPALEFHAAPNGFPLGPTYYIPYEQRFGPQQPQTECYTNLGADPFSLQQPVMPPLAYPMYQPPTVMQQNYMYCQADPFNQCQFNNMPGMTLPQGLGTNLVPLGFMNGNIVYGVPNYVVPPDTFDSPEVEDSPPQRRKFNKQPEDESKPYVKKPLNAFMIYLIEQRPGVMAELPNTDCAAVNRIIGQRWQSLTKEEQAKYYKHADAERELHYQRFPEWSAVDNYGLKRKRVRRKAPAKTEDSST